MLQNAALSVSSREGVASSKETRVCHYGRTAALCSNEWRLLVAARIWGEVRGLGQDQASVSELRTGSRADGRAPEANKHPGRVLTDVGFHIGSNADTDSRGTARRVS